MTLSTKLKEKVREYLKDMNKEEMLLALKALKQEQNRRKKSKKS